VRPACVAAALLFRMMVVVAVEFDHQALATDKEVDAMAADPLLGFEVGDEVRGCFAKRSFNR
jgi:hypothetical protein